MDVIIRTGFQGVSHSIDFNPQAIVKGKNLSSAHVVRVEEVSGITDSWRLIRASVIRQTSVTLTPYRVQIELNSERHVTKVSCTCVSQAGEKCKHIYALIHYVNTDRSASKTTLEQEWGRPSDSQLGKELYAKPLVVTDVFKTEKNTVPVSYNLMYSDISNQACALRTILREKSISENTRLVKSILKDLMYSAISMSEQRDCEACILSLINFSNDRETYSFKKDSAEDQQNNFYSENVHVTDLEVMTLCITTKNQSKSEEWYSARQCRISASSKAHAIKTRTKKAIESLVTDFLRPRSDCEEKLIPALEYGKKHERHAISEYSTKYGVDVKLIGLFVMPSQPWLCASADGIVIENHSISKVLEVKCPSSCRSKPIFDEQARKLNVPYLYLKNDVIELKKTHKYYTQCQILMYTMGLTVCDFYVWSPKGSCLSEVHVDEVFLKSVIPTLEDFHFTYFLKALSESSEENVAVT